VARPAPPSDDGSPARLIATMVGIVGILLLGSLAWSAVGALVSAISSAGQSLTAARSPATLAPAVAVTPTLVPTPTTAPLFVPTLEPSPTELALGTPTPEATKRNPWVLLPLPEPNSRVAPGAITIEARARGDVPISTMRLELDGAALSVSLEQRSESTWRGFASSRVTAGQHTVRATVTDSEGRSGSFRWMFSAGP
jgi:hypothetical protein